MIEEHSDTSRTVEDQDQPQDMSVTPSAPDEEAATGERGGDSPQAKGQERDFDADVEGAKEEIKELEENPPEKLEDWPKGEAMYQTFGGPEGTHTYNEGPEQKLGPDSVRHHEGGDVSIAGEKVDNPEEYKGDPIPGGPTDPNAPDAPGESKPSAESSDDSGEGSSDDS